MKLKEGMYVRTLFGIKKIDHIDNKKTVWKYLYKINDDNEFYALSDNDVIKASYNIIDLIEVDDYVNGKKVSEIFMIDDEKIIFAHDNKYHWFEEDIKSIVTKEQFQSMSYKVGK